MADDLVKQIEALIEMAESAQKPSEGRSAKMKMSEVNTATDPLRDIHWPIEDGALPKGGTVFSTYDPLKGMHHVTLDLGPTRPQYHMDITAQVLDSAHDPASIASTVVATLLRDAGYGPDHDKYRNIKLSWWKWCIDKTIATHVNGTGKTPKHVYITQHVFEDIIQCEDDLPGAKVRATAAGRDRKKVGAIIPNDMDWRTEKQEEGDLLRYIRVA